MNNDKTMGIEKEPALLQQRASRLNSQNHELESRWKFLYSTGERLNAISKRLNSVTHPDNAPKDSAKGVNGQPVPCESSDGIIGSFDDVIAFKTSLLNEFDNSIQVRLERELSYIEKHI